MNTWKFRFLLVIIGFACFVCCRKHNNVTPAFDITYSGTLRVGFPVSFQTNAPAVGTFTWLFDDGSQDTAKSPTHTFRISDSFTVRLVINGDSTKVASKKIFIAPAYNFTFTGAPIVGDTILFNSNAFSTSTLLWDFGDGITSSSFSPVHIYAQPGNYKATMVVDGDTSRLATKNINVVTDPLYTHLIGGMRNWHHQIIYATTYAPPDTVYKADTAFLINYVNPIEIMIGSDTFSYPHSGAGLLYFDRHISAPPTYSEFDKYVYFYYDADSVVFNTNYYNSPGNVIRDYYRSF